MTLNMRRRFKQVARATVVALAATVGLVVLQPAAEAVTLPQLNFTAASLAPDLTQPQHIISQSDGGATVGSCGSGSSTDSFQQYSSTGTRVQTAAATVNNRMLYVCERQSAAGSDGTVYTVAFDPGINKDVLLAFQGGTQKWLYTPPCAVISAVELGTNGNIYMLANSGGCSYPKLLGVEPELATGQTTPTVVTDTDIQRYLPYRGGLSPYDGGVIIRYMDGVGFYTYAGVEQQTYTLPTGYYDSGPFATVEGWAILPLLDQAPRPLECPDDTAATESIAAYSVSGVIWSHQLPPCTRVDGIRPMPDGGAVALTQMQTSFDVNGPVYEQKFYGIPPVTGQQHRWIGASLAPAEGTVRSGLSFVADLNGNLVVQMQLKRRASNGLDYGEAVVTTFSGYTGIGFGGVAFAGGASDGYGFLTPSLGLLPAITDGLAYVTLAECSGFSYCDYSTTKLYAAKMPGLAMDYPRGAVLKHNEPWLDYVAMGDSFSSGEGVPDFEAGTDTAGPPPNGCHRSKQAYSRLLDDNSMLRWNLSSFVACSGAVTTNLTANGQYNESKQILALNSSVDVVSLTIGGNDIGFSDTAYMCIVNQCNTGIALADSGLAYLELSLPGVLEDLRDSVSPGTKIYILGYPHLLPDPNKIESSCQWGNLLGEIAPEEMEELRRIANELNEVISETVAEVGGNTVYVDPRPHFKGHELCTKVPYVNYAQIGPNEEYSLHPNAKGQDVYAESLRLEALS